MSGYQSNNAYNQVGAGYWDNNPFGFTELDPNNNFVSRFS